MKDLFARFKFILFFMIAFLTSGTISGQKLTFDIIKYISPAGWTNKLQNDALVLTAPEKNDSTFCIIMVYKSIKSSGNVSTDFSSAWNEIAVKRLNISAEPAMEKPQSENGWNYLSGTASFLLSGVNSVALLTEISDNTKAMSILVVTNDPKHQGTIESFYQDIEMTIPAQSAPQTETAKVSNVKGAVGDYIFTVPPGWKKEESDDEIALRGPDNASVISILPFMKSSGDLDKDMNDIFWQIFSGWHEDEYRTSDHISTKGVAPDGWSYFKDDVAIAKTDGGNNYRAYGFVFLAQLDGKLAVIAGSYPSKNGPLDETTNVDWQLLFHSLQFKGYKPVSGSQLAKDILGSWITGSYTGMVTYTYAANGHFSSGSAFSTTTQHTEYTVLEKTTSFVGDGTYTLKGNELSCKYSRTGTTITEKVRVYYQKQFGAWQKRLGLLNKSTVDGSLYEVTLAYQEEK